MPCVHDPRDSPLSSARGFNGGVPPLSSGPDVLPAIAVGIAPDHGRIHMGALIGPQQFMEPLVSDFFSSSVDGSHNCLESNTIL